MSLAVLLNTAFEMNLERYVDSEGRDDREVGTELQETVITALSETPLRVEVYEKAEPHAMDGLSIADVHVVLDALIEVLKGE